MRSFVRSRPLTSPHPPPTTSGATSPRPAPQWLATQAAQKGDNTAFDAIVWEALRFNPMTTFVLRVAAQPAVLAPGTSYQVTVPAGRVVAAGIGSAMFDPGVFPGPDDFQTRPRDLYLHVGFGAHICLGQYVAYEIIPEAVRQILLVPGVHLLPQGGSAVDNAAGPFAESMSPRACLKACRPKRPSG